MGAVQRSGSNDGLLQVRHEPGPLSSLHCRERQEGFNTHQTDGHARLQPQPPAIRKIWLRELAGALPGSSRPWAPQKTNARLTRAQPQCVFDGPHLAAAGGRRVAQPPSVATACPRDSIASPALTNCCAKPADGPSEFDAMCGRRGDLDSFALWHDVSAHVAATGVQLLRRPSVGHGNCHGPAAHNPARPRGHPTKRTLHTGQCECGRWLPAQGLPAILGGG